MRVSQSNILNHTTRPPVDRFSESESAITVKTKARRVTSELRVPDSCESPSNHAVTSLYVEAGESFSRSEPLLQLSQPGVVIDISSEPGIETAILKEWMVDRGDVVQPGQILGVIEYSVPPSTAGSHENSLKQISS